MSSLLLAAAAAALTPAQPAPAAPDGGASPTVTADEALANAKAIYASAPHKAAPCLQAKGDEIVVCAEHEDPATQYVPSETDSGSTYDGVPHAPDVSSLPSCAGAGMCMRVGKKPRNPLIIDLKSIPEPPPGSDADKISKGEKAAP